MWPLGQCNTTPPVIKQINPCKWTDATVPIVQWSKIYEEAICDDANTHFMTQRQSRQDHYMHHLQDREKKENAGLHKVKRNNEAATIFANKISVCDHIGCLSIFLGDSNTVHCVCFLHDSLHAPGDHLVRGQMFHCFVNSSTNAI